MNDIIDVFPFYNDTYGFHLKTKVFLNINLPLSSNNKIYLNNKIIIKNYFII